MMTFSSCSSGDDPGDPDPMRAMFGPGHVDQMVRNAVQAAWMARPKERRTVEQTEAVLRHLVDRALKDFREDAITFGD